MSYEQSAPEKARPTRRISPLIYTPAVLFWLVVALIVGYIVFDSREWVKNPYGVDAYWAKLEPKKVHTIDFRGRLTKGNARTSIEIPEGYCLAISYSTDDWSLDEAWAIANAMAYRKRQLVNGWTDEEMYALYKENGEYSRNMIKENGWWGKEVGGSVYDDAHFDVFDESVFTFLRGL